MNGALDVARYIVNYSNEIDCGTSNLKLQKLLYFVQAYFLVELNRQCFHEEIEAWDFGPVVPCVYHEFKQFGSATIPPVVSVFKIDQENIWASTMEPYTSATVNRDDLPHINTVVDMFKDYSASQLVDITHGQRPWKDAYVYRENRPISVESIEEYFNTDDD